MHALPHITPLSAGHFFITCASPTKPAEAQWLDINFWRDQNSVYGQSLGRSATYFINNVHGEFVLRHYYRGGAIRHISKDCYIFCGPRRTRLYEEFSILEQLKNWGLPAPTPVAGRIIRKGLFYKADLMMEKIPNATDIFQLLQKQGLSFEAWKSIGATIAAFHKRGVYHADLNCHNLMRDNQGTIWLIDFDKAKIHTPESGRAGWAAQNLARLYRSLVKEREKNSPFYFEDNHWEQLLAGYDSSQ